MFITGPMNLAKMLVPGITKLSMIATIKIPGP